MLYFVRVLLLLPLCLFSGQIIAAQITHAQHIPYSASEKIGKLTQSAFESATPTQASHTTDLRDSDVYYRHLTQDILCLWLCRRSSANDNERSLPIEPDYHLLIAFLPPPLLALAMKATPLPLDATLFAKRKGTPRLLLRWKQANLQYVSTHSRKS